METALSGRVPIRALSDIERFLESAQHLKALAVQLHTLQCRDSRRQAALAQQINTFTQHCGALAQAHPRLVELWTQTQDELHAVTPGVLPPAGGAPRNAPAQPACPGAAGGGNCSPGARASMTNGKPAN